MLISDDGYCFFRDDVNSQQARAAVTLQRERDKQRQELEAVKKQQQQEAALQQQAAAADYTLKKTTSGKTASTAAPAAVAPQTAAVQYKRAARPDENVRVSVQQSGAVAQQPSAPVSKSPRVNIGIVFVLLVTILWFVVYRKWKKP
ncbi:MAG: hypothetical protein Q7U74_09515, partial [Saprospiraceae bacterium]|nr:hypothetical protein [Saprospiraceae bacterium]